jgi:hypothetical protein
MGTAVLLSADEPVAKTSSRNESDFVVDMDGVGEARMTGLPPLTHGDRVGLVYGCKCSVEGEKEGSSVDKTGMCRWSRGDMGIGIATAVDMVQTVSKSTVREQQGSERVRAKLYRLLRASGCA